MFVSHRHLSRSERGELALLLRQRKSLRQIGQMMERDASTISRERKRNADSDGRYLAESAQKKANERAQNSRRPAMRHSPEVIAYVREKLLLSWSPEQISGRLPLDYPDDPGMRVSFNTIYRWLRRDLIPQATQLKAHLRRHAHRHNEQRGKKVGARELRTRCKDALRRKRLGDWEVDTIVMGQQPNRRHLLNIVDRKSRFCCLAVLKNTTKDDLIRAFSFFFGSGELPLLTMTADRGHEFSCHHEFEQTFQALFYFTRPASPWQKPTVENTNGLVRQFFPRGSHFRELSDQAAAFVMDTLNERPRKCLGWLSPAEVIRSG